MKDKLEPVWWVLGLGAIGLGLASLLARFFNVATPVEIVRLSMGTKVLNRSRANGVDARLEQFLDWWDASGPFPITVAIDGGVRTLADQQRLYAQGRTTPGPNAGKPGFPPLGSVITYAASNSTSAHGHRAAIDVYPVIGGKVYVNPNDPVQRAKFDEMGRAGEAYGVKWGGRFVVNGKPFYDGGHFELPDWESLPVAV